MYCLQYEASDYNKNHRIFSCNAFWVTIKQNGKIVYKREAHPNSKWMDESHRRITNALEQLEKAILEAPIESV